jgi:hypothetical protein
MQEGEVWGVKKGRLNKFIILALYVIVMGLIFWSTNYSNMLAHRTGRTLVFLVIWGTVCLLIGCLIRYGRLTKRK